MSGKKRRSASEWRGIVSEYEQSGLSLKEFSRERGLSEWSVRQWRKRSAGGIGEFVEVTLPSSGAAPYSVLLRNGRELRLGSTFSEKRVEQLVEVLERC